jgi:TPP-dependent pyruvate/acetoin dehydrogenase alpha subunit
MESIEASGQVAAGLGPAVPTSRLEPKTLLELYDWMALSRALDEYLSERLPHWFPSTGEEATIVGAFHGLREDDVAAPHYRGPQIVFLMRGVPIETVMATALGKATGLTKGRAPAFCGPMKRGIVPWVAGDLGPNVSLATGAALGLKYRRTDRVVVATIGDGTTNRGDFHEAVNLGAVWRLPVVYVCQNNLYSISLHASQVFRCATIADRALGYGIPGVIVDGNDVLAVREAVTAAAARARAGEGPSLIEAQTYRLKGHWAGDTAAYRPAGELEAWQAKDPLPRFERQLVQAGIASAESLAAARERARARVEAAAAAVADHPPAEEGGIGEQDLFA